MSNPFDPHPRFENHMCHFRPWSEHYKDAEGEIGTLARMLGYAWDEVDRLRVLHQEETKALSIFQFAYVMGVTTEKASQNTVPTIPEAMEYIRALNDRRREGLFTWPK
jgi:hypothetical protein